MSGYIRTSIIFIENNPNEPPPIMNPRDISIMDSFIRRDIQSLLNEFVNIVEENSIPKTSEESFKNLKETTDPIECPICFKKTTDNKELFCKHVFCKSCIKRWLTEKCNTCPICREVV